MAAAMASSCFSVLYSTVKFHSSFPSRSHPATTERSTALLTPTAISDRRTSYGSRRRSSSSSGNFDVEILHCNGLRHSHRTPRSYIRYGPSYGEEDDDPQVQVESLRVPAEWSVPSKALEESQWLRVTLHKWLDDEYCPEETNIVISKVAANSYYNSLLEKRTDLADILLNMARELESISYKESFHGAFSSANAAVNLIAQRIELS